MIDLVDTKGKPRKMSISIYLAALFISSILFVSGIYIGKMIEASNVSSLSSGIENVNSKLGSMELLYLIGDEAPYMCPVFLNELADLDRQTEDFGKKISFLEEQKGVEDERLKRDYFMLEARAFLFSQKVRSACGSNYTTILYFYTNKGCSNCYAQGKELSALKSKLGESVRIYSFDGKLGSPIVDALMLKTNASSYPSISINSGDAIGGLLSKEDLLSRISNQ